MSFFGGPKTFDKGADPTFERMNQGLYSFRPRKGYGLKMDKQNMKALYSGADVSSLGQFNPIRQFYAAQHRDIDDRSMYGANALVAQMGGEQSNLLNRSREIAHAEADERQGRDMVNATSDFREAAANRLYDWNKFRQGSMLNAQQTATGNQLNYYNSRFGVYQDPGFLGRLKQIADFAGSAAGAVTGLKGLGAGGSLPVRPSYPISRIPSPSYPG